MSGFRATFVLALLLMPAPASSDTVLIEAARDATLIEDPNGALANGAGPVFFVGRTNQRAGSVRRALVYFDVARSLPADAWIEDARLTLYMAPSNAVPSRIGLHRLLAGWGEGASFASGGGGDASQQDDATWLHRFYGDRYWVQPGGHFVARASARLDVADSALYAWAGTPKMIADLRLWHEAPRRNFGWILIGDETTPQNAKAFVSREGDPSLRPVLEVTYQLRARR